MCDAGPVADLSPLVDVRDETERKREQCSGHVDDEIDCGLSHG